MSTMRSLGRVIVLLQAAAWSWAQLAGFPHGGGNCTTEDDCSLGGECVQNECVCDIWFTGATCAYLNLQPPVDTEVGLCGSNMASYFSWGGRTVFEPSSGQYHLYASFMCNHQTLDAWTTASSSAHFVSTSPTGPFVWSGEECDASGICVPSIIPWSHNTVIVPNLPGQSPAYMIWHIGDGIVNASVWSPCFNASDTLTAGAVRPATHGSAPDRTNVHDGPGNTAYVTFSDSPSGPWTRAFNNTGVVINFTGSWTQQLAGNPAPFLESDGRMKLYFTATPCPANSGALAPNCIAVATASSWEGPYSMNAAAYPITYPESEDPSVFRDFRGNYHLLTNVNTYHRRCAAGVPCGGHAWSRDGLRFSNLTIGAFGPTISFANGSLWTNAYVERPLVTMAPDGVTPLAFHVGLGRSSYSDSCNWVQLFCTPNATNCGPTRPPPPRLVALRNGGSCLVYNASAFPCSGTAASAGCPVYMGDCGSDGAQWLIPGSSGIAGSFISASSAANATTATLALNVDCDYTAPHTLVKVLASGPVMLTLDEASGTIAYAGGMCLNTGQGPAVPPCGPKGEVWLPNQIQLAPCGDPTAAGWSAVPL